MIIYIIIIILNILCNSFDMIIHWLTIDNFV